MCHAHVFGRDDPLLVFPAPVAEAEATPEARLYARGYEVALRCAEAALLAQRGDVTMIKAISRDRHAGYTDRRRQEPVRPSHSSPKRARTPEN